MKKKKELIEFAQILTLSAMIILAGMLFQSLEMNKGGNNKLNANEMYLSVLNDTEWKETESIPYSTCYSHVDKENNTYDYILCTKK